VACPSQVRWRRAQRDRAAQGLRGAVHVLAVHRATRVMVAERAGASWAGAAAAMYAAAALMRVNAAGVM
jgi:hypothetical protein